MIASLRKLCFCVAAAEDCELSSKQIWFGCRMITRKQSAGSAIYDWGQPSRFPRYVILAQLGVGWGGVCDEHRQVTRSLSLSLLLTWVLSLRQYFLFLY